MSCSSHIDFGFWLRREPFGLSAQEFGEAHSSRRKLSRTDFGFAIGIMNKTPSEQPHQPEDELLAEYHFDYQKAKPNRFATSDKTQNLTVVVLDEDVAQVFTTPESVNKVLRALIESMPKSESSKRADH